MDVELRKLRLEDKTTILEMLADFEATGSRHDGFFGGADFAYEDWLETIQLAEAGLGLPEGFVPYIQLVAFTADGQAVGFLNLRLLLNDHLLQEGGHIGYSIRPSARGKGLAKEQLRQGLQVAKSKNIKRALVTCDEDNEASRRTILSAGGVYENTIDRSQRYWIDID
ncbi:GNAT family N-acetyltransferase [Streptococcus gordonii]|uniref:GNAT family N-acetyltransferase n=1 Tax=Streptococcus gordonii TaxID=1302 RepID=UPI0005F31ADD|nr:GNAT family N-acetyltransferase [Streptococcus gordonii]KJU97555.1 acetyltransferase (GNAT) family protein [Streptococcus gordonii]